MRSAHKYHFVISYSMEMGMGSCDASCSNTEITVTGSTSTLYIEVLCIWHHLYTIYIYIYKLTNSVYSHILVSESCKLKLLWLLEYPVSRIIIGSAHPKLRACVPCFHTSSKIHISRESSCVANKCSAEDFESRCKTISSYKRGIFMY